MLGLAEHHTAKLEALGAGPLGCSGQTHLGRKVQNRMIGSSSTSTLVSLIDQLQVELLECKSQVRRLEERVAVLEEKSDRAPSEFDVVSEAAERAPATPPRASSSVGDSGLPAFRVQAAEEIGRWLRRGLKGEHRGLSGREKIPQGNQYYLVVRDLSGCVHDPPLLFRAWSEAKSHCQAKGQCGDSVFVGLPSQAEVRIALRAAQLRFPAALERH